MTMNNVSVEHFVYYAFHKPRGVETAHESKSSRPSIVDFLPGEKKNDVVALGNLDQETQGLVLLSNDPHFIDPFLQEGSKVERLYEIVLKRPLKFQEVNLLQNGFSNAEVKIYPSEVVKQKQTRQGFTVTLKMSEGPKVDFRSVLESLGLEIISLQCLGIGPVRLGMLPVGRLRPLTSKEASFFLSNANMETHALSKD